MSQAKQPHETDTNWVADNVPAKTDELLAKLETLPAVADYETKNNGETIIVTSTAECDEYSFARHVIHHAAIVNYGFALHHIKNPDKTDTDKTTLVISTINRIQQMTLSE